MTRFHKFCSFVAACTLCCAVAATPAIAANFSYADITGTDVMFLDIEEDTGPATFPLFGAPSGVNNKLDFDPTSFFASASSTSPSVTQSGTLSFTVMTMGAPIESLMVTELGDFSIVGLGAATASVSASGMVSYSVTEVDGVAITPVMGSIPITVNPSSASLPVQFGNWSGVATADIQGLLASNSIFGSATKVEFSILNELQADVSNGGSAFLAKKDFGVMVMVPEPSSVLLLGMAFSTLAIFAVRRR